MPTNHTIRNLGLATLCIALLAAIGAFFLLGGAQACNSQAAGNDPKPDYQATISAMQQKLDATPAPTNPAATPVNTPTPVPTDVVQPTCAPCVQPTTAPIVPPTPMPNPTATPQPTPASIVNVVDDPSSACGVINDYQLQNLTEISTSRNNTIHVEFFTADGQPEFEAVLAGGRYTFPRGLRGHVWEYQECSFEEVRSQVDAHIARRLAQKVNNGGWASQELINQLFTLMQ